MFDLSWDEEQAFYTAIGAIIINWGIAESSIAQACHILNQAGGHKSQRLPPTGMKRRLDLIKSCFKDYPELRHMRDFTRSLITNTKEMAKERDKIVHGAIKAFDRQTQTFVFIRIDAGKYEFYAEDHKFPVTNLLELSAAAAQISADWIELVQGMYSIRDSKNGLKYADRVWHVTVRIWAHNVYQRIQRLIGVR